MDKKDTTEINAIIINYRTGGSVVYKIKTKLQLQLALFSIITDLQDIDSIWETTIVKEGK
tara:strand:+ start:443 stop:622 length:180 start_codon:yes stop_codon:yes gene_type:complete